MIDFVVFDMDHTLVASVSYLDAWHAELEARGLGDRFHVSTDNAWGRSLYDNAAIALDCDPADPRALEFVGAFWMRFGAPDVPELDGASEALHALSTQGKTLYLSTGSSPVLMRRYVDLHGWDDLFALCLASPHDCLKGAEHYRLIREHAGAGFEKRTLAVGDGASDMRFALAAGVAFRAGYLYPREGVDGAAVLKDAGANLIVSSLRDVPAIAAASSDAELAAWTV